MFENKKLAFLLITALIAFPVLANAEEIIDGTVVIGVDEDKSLSDITIDGDLSGSDLDSGYGVLMEGGSRFTGNNVIIKGDDVGIGYYNPLSGNRRSDVNMTGVQKSPVKGLV